MEDHPAAAVRRKRDASINVCMRLVRDGVADAVVTAGHTGEPVLPGTFVDYALKPREYELSVAQTVLRAVLPSWTV